jgi:hypothetical protein
LFLTTIIVQVMVFGNLFTFSTVSAEITDVLLRLTEDSKIEVRAIISKYIFKIESKNGLAWNWTEY